MIRGLGGPGLEDSVMTFNNFNGLPWLTMIIQLSLYSKMCRLLPAVCFILNWKLRGLVCILW